MKKLIFLSLVGLASATLFQNCSTPTLDDSTSSASTSSTALQFMSYPSSQQIAIGQPVTLTTSVYSSLGLTLRYQWYKNSAVLSGATTNTLYIANTTASDVGSYYLQVTDGTNVASTPAFSLYLASASTSLSITTNPVAQTIAPGGLTRFSVIASDSLGSALTYQWYKNGVAISGQTTNEMYITSTTSSDAGYYAVDVSNGTTTIRSSAVLLTVALTSTSCSSIGGSFYGTHCYVVNRTLTTWDTAESSCRSLGGHLAIITTSSENYFVYSIAQTAVWIGARDVASEGTFLWPDGTTVAFGNFASGEPNGGTNENCVQMTATSTWNDLSCAATRGYVCEI